MEKKNEKKRSEHLSTTIGDLMKLQGNDILKTEKKPYKKNNKNKKNFKGNKNKQYKEKKVETPAETKNEEAEVIFPVLPDVSVSGKPDRNGNMYTNECLKKAIDDAVEKGIIRADDNTKFDMRTPEQIEADKYKDGVEIKDGTMKDFAAAFLAVPEPEGPKMDEEVRAKKKFVINSEYITCADSDARVRTDEFINK